MISGRQVNRLRHHEPVRPEVVTAPSKVFELEVEVLASGRQCLQYFSTRRNDLLANAIARDGRNLVDLHVLFRQEKECGDSRHPHLSEGEVEGKARLT